MKKLYYLSAFVCISCFIIACSGDKKEHVRVHPRIDTQMARTAQDSADVLNLTNRYLDLLKAEQFDEALNMLYTFNSEDSIVQPISDVRRREFLNTFGSFPVLRYEIDTLLMFNEFDTEVRYTYEFFEKPEGSTMPNTVSGTVCPHRYQGQWYLVVPAEKSEVRNIVRRTKY